MGDLEKDTAVARLDDGYFQAELSSDWEIWGPMGGYVAAVALRAAGAAGDHPYPGALSCHFLRAAQFGQPVDLHVVRLKTGRVAESHRVEVSQDGRPVLEAMVWSVAEVDGLEHDETRAPEVLGPADVPGVEELYPEAQPSYPFWRNFDVKPLAREYPWPPDGPRTAEWQEWLRFRPTASYDDPWVDAARSVVLVDLPSFPAANRPHAWKQPPYTAPTLDLNVAFHQPTGGEDWLLCDGAAPLATRGMFGWTARVWSPGGTLHASGGGQCLYRRLPDPAGS